MLGKLMKYELMAMGRVFLPMYAALLIVSIVNNLLVNFATTTPAVIGIVGSGLLIAGISVITLVLTLQRFSNNLLSNEGYLMMTLPVSTDRLILSKMFVAAIWGVASFLVIMLSVMLMAMSSIDFLSVANVIRRFFEMLAIQPFHYSVYAIEAVVGVVLATFGGILMLYTCMSLSMLVNKRRGLFTFGAFVVISTALQIMATILVTVSSSLNLVELLRIGDMSQFGQSQFVILTVLVLEAVLCAGFYFTTRFMLKNRLNLQ
jgi:hypothetical protein